MPLLIVILGILLLFVLIAKFKLNAFISFIIVCVFVGVFQGMELDRVVEAIQIGMGNTLGFLVMILGLGAMLGKLVSDSGAAQRITSKLVSSFGIKHIQWAVVVATGTFYSFEWHMGFEVQTKMQQWRGDGKGRRRRVWW